MSTTETIETPAAVQQDIDTTEQVAKPDPLDRRDVQIAAGQYAQNIKSIRALAKNMKAGQLSRVMIAAATFPFGEEYPTFRNQSERELFILLTSNDKSKYVISDALKEQEQMLQQLAADNVSDQILSKGGL